MVAYHWHPGGASHAAAPHLHLGSTQLSADAILTNKHHMPTSRVSIEQVLQLLINEHAVEPQVSDWRERLALSHGLFELHRSWSTTPDDRA